MPFNIHLRNRIIDIKSPLKCFNQFDQSGLSLCQIFTPLAHIGRCPDHYSTAIICSATKHSLHVCYNFSHAKLLEVKFFTLKRISLRNSCANLISFFLFEKSTTNTVSSVSISLCCYDRVLYKDQVHYKVGIYCYRLVIAVTFLSIV